MKRIIFLISYLLLVVILLTSCTSKVKHEESVYISSRFVCVEWLEMPTFDTGYGIYVDKETRVCYLFVCNCSDAYGMGSGIAFAPIINSDGTPMLYEGDLGGTSK